MKLLPVTAAAALLLALGVAAPLARAATPVPSLASTVTDLRPEAAAKKKKAAPRKPGKPKKLRQGAPR